MVPCGARLFSNPDELLLVFTEKLEAREKGVG